MIEIDSYFDALIISIILTSLFLMCFTFLGVALNGQKLWREPNDFILYTEIFLFFGCFMYIIYDGVLDLL